MFDNEYEEYMRSVLGYPMSEGSYYVGQGRFPYRSTEPNRGYSHLYPEIYNKLQPLVSRACNDYTGMNICKEDIESMTTEICNKYEAEEEVSSCNNKECKRNTNDTTRNDIKANESSAQSINKFNNTNKNSVMNVTSQNSSRLGTGRNPLLKDLIKILIINQLIHNNQNRPPRPPMNPYPPIGRPPRPREMPYGMSMDGMDIY